MKRHIKYASYVLRHKWFVFVECCRLGIPVRGLLHDASKLMPSEWLPYANHFAVGIKRGRDKTGYYKPTDTGDKAFDFAWLLHQKRNDHHWQWWLVREDDGSKLADRARAVLADKTQDDLEDPCGCHPDSERPDHRQPPDRSQRPVPTTKPRARPPRRPARASEPSPRAPDRAKLLDALPGLAFALGHTDEHGRPSAPKPSAPPRLETQQPQETP